MDDKKIVLYVRDPNGHLRKLLDSQTGVIMGIREVKDAVETIANETLSCKVEISEECYEALMEQIAVRKINKLAEEFDKIADDYIFIDPLDKHEWEPPSVCKPKCWKYNKRRNFKSQAYWKRIRSRTW